MDEMNYGFDVNTILSPEEAEEMDKRLNAEDDSEESDQQENDEKEEVVESSDEKETDEAQKTESVDNDEDNKVGEKAASQSDGASPGFYSSIAKALVEDGIFPDLDEKELDKVKTNEDFGELVENAIKSRMDERINRIDSALRSGVQPDVIKTYETALNSLDNVSEDQLKEEGQEGEELRKYLIMNDFLTRGYSQERAEREVKKSLDGGTDIDDARDALEGLKNFYANSYNKVLENAKKEKAALEAMERKRSEDFRKLVIDSEDPVLGDMKLDRNTRQRVYDAATKPVYKDPKTGRLMTVIQKEMTQNPLEFQKQVALWYVLTNGGKSLDGVTKGKIRSEKHKAIRNLEQTLSGMPLNDDGTLKLAGGDSGTGMNPFDGSWKIGRID